MSIQSNVDLVKDFLTVFLSGNLDKDKELLQEYMGKIDDNAQLFGKNKEDFANMVKPERDATFERTIAQDEEWVAAVFDSNEELKRADTLEGIAVVRFGFFVKVDNGKIKELHDYVGIKDDKNGAVFNIVCYPSRCPRC